MARAELPHMLRQKSGSVVNNASEVLDPGWPITKENMAEASALKTPMDTIRQTMEANVYGAFRMCQVVIPVMIKQDYGRIVNVTSNMGQLSSMQGGWAAYRMSKTALNVETLVPAIENLLNTEFFPASVYVISDFPAEMRWPDVVKILAAAFAMSLLSTIYPAWRASKVQPAEALRYE